MGYSKLVKGRKWYLHRVYRDGRPFYHFTLSPRNSISLPAGYEFGGVASRPFLPYIKKVGKENKPVRRRRKR